MTETQDGRYVRVLKRARRLYFDTNQPKVSFELTGLINGRQSVAERYSIARSGPHPTLFFIERPGEFEMTACAIRDETLDWPGESHSGAGVRVDRNSVGGSDYCRWIYVASNDTDQSVSGQVDFYHSEEVRSRSIFNLDPAGGPHSEAEINIVISIDKDAHITSQVLFKNKVWR